MVDVEALRVPPARARLARVVADAAVRVEVPLREEVRIGRVVALAHGVVPRQPLGLPLGEQCRGALKAHLLVVVPAMPPLGLVIALEGVLVAGVDHLHALLAKVRLERFHLVLRGQGARLHLNEHAVDGHAERGNDGVHLGRVEGAADGRARRGVGDEGGAAPLEVGGVGAGQLLDGRIGEAEQLLLLEPHLQVELLAHRLLGLAEGGLDAAGGATIDEEHAVKDERHDGPAVSLKALIHDHEHLVLPLVVDDGKGRTHKGVLVGEEDVVVTTVGAHAVDDGLPFRAGHDGGAHEPHAPRQLVHAVGHAVRVRGRLLAQPLARAAAVVCARHELLGALALLARVLQALQVESDDLLKPRLVIHDVINERCDGCLVE